jgi:metal-dependent HD superfamily phosphatase/phosphodiesterase
MILEKEEWKKQKIPNCCLLASLLHDLGMSIARDSMKISHSISYSFYRPILKRYNNPEEHMTMTASTNRY